MSVVRTAPVSMGVLLGSNALAWGSAFPMRSMPRPRPIRVAFVLRRGHPVAPSSVHVLRSIPAVVGWIQREGLGVTRTVQEVDAGERPVEGGTDIRVP